MEKETSRPSMGSAAVLAGGASRRMNRDKALLPVNGIPLIERVCRQLQPGFSHIHISASSPGKYDFLGFPVVIDEKPEIGPMMAVLSALRASPTDRLFVTACDIPDIDISYIRKMAHCDLGCRLIMPRYKSGRLEPLFAFYHRCAIPVIEELLQRDIRKLAVLTDHFPTFFFPADEQPWLKNLNTVDDYRRLLQGGFGQNRSMESRNG